MTEAVEKRLKQEDAEEAKRIELFERIKRTAESNPVAYRVRIAALSALGWLYLGLLLLVSVAAIGQFVLSFYTDRRGWGIIALLGFYLLFAIVKSLLVHSDESEEGVDLNRDEFPEIYSEVEELANRFASDPIHSICIVYHANAYASERPRFGMFGGYRRKLALGLPLLLALPLDEVRSIIAHEVGHFSGKHGPASLRIYRLRNAWYELGLHALEADLRINKALIVPFAKWYLKYLYAYEKVMRRRQEVEADLRALEACGQAAGLALIRSNFLRTKMNVFYDGVHDLVRTQDEPPRDFAERLTHALRTPISIDRLSMKLEFELKEGPDIDVPHLPLSERLKLLTIDPNNLPNIEAMAALPNQVAADILLGSNMDLVLRSVSNEWFEDGIRHWAEQRKEVLDQKEALVKSQLMPKQRADHFLDEALIVEDVDGIEKALGMYAEAYQLEPDNSRAVLFYGLALLALEREDGIPLVERAMQLDVKYRKIGCERLTEFYKAIGDHGRYAQSLDRYRRSETAAEISEEEWLNYDRGDELLPHGLSELEIDKVKQSLSKVRGIERLFIARKVLHRSGLGNKLVVVAIPNTRYFSFRFLSQEPEDEIGERVRDAIDLPEECAVFGVKANSPMAKALRAAQGAHIPLIDHKR